MKKLGFKKIITTPHTMKNVWFNDETSIKTALNNLKNEEKNLTENLYLKAASEYFLDEYFLKILA